MKSVVVTGAAGFLGRFVTAEFLRAGWRVVGLDTAPPASIKLSADFVYHPIKLPSPELAPLLKAERPLACVHCAGSASVPLSLTDPGADFNGNVVLTFQLLDLLRRNAPQCHFLLLSSAAVYGNPDRLPVAETDPVAPLSPYGYHKRQAELLCEEFSRIYGLPTTSVRIFSAYGPGLRRQVVWDICQKALGVGPIRLQGTGQESRDFIHAADVGRALTCFAERSPGQGELYNLAAGRETTIAELASRLLKTLGRSESVEFDGINPQGNPLRWRADVARLAALGFVPAYPLERGLEEVAAWSLQEAASR